MCGDLCAYLGKRAKLRPAGVAGVEPTSAGLEPAVRSAGLHPFEWLVIQLWIWSRNAKEPPPRGKRLLNELDVCKS
jgi:hypothetical protein